jgi:hypothetical protein
MVTLEQLRSGSKVLVRGGFGTTSAKRATVDNVEEDIKNGSPGIDYTVDSSGEQHWAYLDQVQRVLAY